MRSISAGVAARFCEPSTWPRTEPCGTIRPTLTPGRAATSRARCCTRSTDPPPSGFTTTVVIPSASSGAAALSAGDASPGPACECVSMKPGAT
jgi:hypothetical protein